jgi:glucuronoarabinoxylan endo-1,4-beta-xylanase
LRGGIVHNSPVASYRDLFLLAISIFALHADTVTFASGANYISVDTNGALTATAGATKAQVFERLYAGNGYFYLRANEFYVATDPATGALSLAAPNTSQAEQFQTTGAGSTSNITVRSTSAYVAITATAVLANAPLTQASPFTLTATPDAASRVEIDFANPRQEIVGFGAADAFYTNWLTAHPNKEQIYSLLFGRSNLGASILRVQNIYGQQQAPSTPFDPDTEEVVAKANAYRGSPITVLMSSWSPPGNLKASGQVSCKGATTEPGCTLAKVNGSYNYAGFAQYWYDSLNAYAALGVRPNYISLQNEPDFTPNGYGGCRFDPSEQASGIYAGYREALNAVYPRLQTLSNPPVIVGPEVIGLGYNTIEHYLSALDSNSLAELGAIAHHLYHGGDSGAPDSFDGSMLQLAGAAPSIRLFETEFDHSSDQKTAMNTAWLIHNAMATEEASAYLYWSYFWPDTNQLVYIDFLWNPGQWIYSGAGYNPNDYYYAIQHFSRFVQPGFQRIASITGLTQLRATAYYNFREHRLVFVLINTSATDTLQPALIVPALVNARRAFSDAAAQYRRGPSAVYRSTFSGPGERFAPLGPLAANGVVTLPPQSVATVVIDEFRRAGGR